MNYTTSQVRKQSRFIDKLIESRRKEEKLEFQEVVSIPAYLEKIYWWAYIHPNAVAFFDRHWIINLILMGNFVKLRDLALNELGFNIHGRILQIACVYGDFSVRLAQHLGADGSLDIVDVVPIQLENVRRKLPFSVPVRLIQRDSTSLQLADTTYDQVILFFLLHEMPAVVREKTLSEALRVLKPGGKLVIVDFHKPSALNPFRYLYPPMFRLLEPFALDIWRESIEQWLPKGFMPAEITKETMFGGLYQKVVIRK
jgi:ubiquinone/menaquinone biosynthesis C-methylase UbiE